MPAKKPAKSKKSESSEPSGAPKVFDVAKPGETAADASSRPLIVGHGSMIKQDPMVVDSDSSEATPVSKTGVSIQPNTDTDAEEVATAKTPKSTAIKVLDDAPEEKSEEPQKDEAIPEPEPEKIEEPPKETVDTEKPAKEKEEAPTEAQPEAEEASQPESSEVAATNVLANELVAKKAAEEKAKEAAKAEAHTQELIASKQYFVNIHQSATSGGAGKWILLLLLLLIVGAVAAIDAGLVDAGISLPFDLIKN